MESKKIILTPESYQEQQKKAAVEYLYLNGVISFFLINNRRGKKKYTQLRLRIDSKYIRTLLFARLEMVKQKMRDEKENRQKHKNNM